MSFKRVIKSLNLKNRKHSPSLALAQPVLIREKGEDSLIEIVGVSDEINAKIVVKIGARSRVLVEGIETLNSSLIILLGDDCVLHMKSGQKINGPMVINQNESSTVTIGSNGLFGRCKIWTSDFHSLFDKHTKVRINPAKDVTLGDHVWLGEDALILKGCVVGDDSVVAAHSVVTKSYPNNSLIGGNPSRLLKSDINWDASLLPNLLEDD